MRIIRNWLNLLFDHLDAGAAETNDKNELY
jgi:hypothetical protein